MKNAASALLFRHNLKQSSVISSLFIASKAFLEFFIYSVIFDITDPIDISRYNIRVIKNLINLRRSQFICHIFPSFYSNKCVSFNNNSNINKVFDRKRKKPFVFSLFCQCIHKIHDLQHRNPYFFPFVWSYNLNSCVSKVLRIKNH